MKVAVFSPKNYDQKFLSLVNSKYDHELHFFEPRLTAKTASLAQNFPAVCVFVNDQLGQETLNIIAPCTKLIALRCAGFNNVDLKAA